MQISSSLVVEKNITRFARFDVLVATIRKRFVRRETRVMRRQKAQADTNV